MSEFIHVEIVGKAALPLQIVEVCPVAIFAARQDRVEVVGEREDECTLCGLCFEVAPAGSLCIYKLYSGEVLAGRTTV